MVYSGEGTPEGSFRVHEPADVTIQNEGSICLAHLNTDAAREWVNENVSDESQYFGQALVVEPRYLDNLIAGMCEAGLTVE